MKHGHDYRHLPGIFPTVLDWLTGKPPICLLLLWLLIVMQCKNNVPYGTTVFFSFTVTVSEQKKLVLPFENVFAVLCVWEPTVTRSMSFFYKNLPILTPRPRNPLFYSIDGDRDKISIKFLRKLPVTHHLNLI